MANSNSSSVKGIGQRNSLVKKLKILYGVVKRYANKNGSVSFWHTEISLVDYDFSSLDDYYIDLTSKLEYQGPHDDHGVPMLNYFGQIGTRYNPCAVAQWGLGAYQAWRRGNADCELSFWLAVQWLEEKTVLKDGMALWEYDFDLVEYSIRKPWISGLAQGQIVSLLVRAYKASDDERYLNLASMAAKSLITPIQKGGVLLRELHYVAIEEVVTERPSVILDGLLYAVLGLQDYCYLPVQREYREVLAELVDSIQKILPSYDLGYWSRADIYFDDVYMPSSGFYHKLHVIQLAAFAKIYPDTNFLEYSERWRSMSHNKLCRARALLSKIKFKLLYY